MTIAEASRQYQATLEAWRTLANAHAGEISMLEELDDAHDELERSWRTLENAWWDHALTSDETRRYPTLGAP